MPDIKIIEKSLDTIADNPQHPQADQVMNKLGIGPTEVQAWKAVKDNPQHPKKTEVRNKIFDNIAGALPAQEQTFGDRFSAGPIGFSNRFQIKNILDRDPALAQKTLEKQGFQTRVMDGEVQVKKPGEAQFQKIEFEGIDIFDLADVAFDIAAGVFTGGAAVAGGLAGAPLGPVAAGTGLVAGGAAGAATAEAAKEAIGVATGLRPEFDPGRIRQEAILGGATAPLGPIATRGAAATGRFISKTAPKMVENVKAVREAGKRLGIKPALRQIYDDDTVRLLEENLEKNLGTIPGFKMRIRAKATQQKLDEIADAMIGRAKNLDLVDVGEAAKKNIQESVKTRLAPVEAIYKQVQGFLKGADEFVDDDFIRGQVDAIADKYRFDPGSESTLNFFKRKVGEISNLNDLKIFRTNVGKAIQDAKRSNDIAKIRALGDLYDAATTARSRSLDKMIDLADDMDSQLAQPAKEALKKADAQYRAISTSVQDALLKRGQVSSQSAKALAEGLENIKEIKLAKQLLDTDDPKKMRQFREVFPDAFEILREGKIAEVAKAATNQRKNQLRLGTIMDRFGKMPKASKEMIFGADFDAKIKDLQTLFQVMPAPINPSGTSHNLLSATGWGQAVISNFSALGSRIRLSLLTNRAKLGQFLQNTAEAIGDQNAIAITNRMVRESVPTEAEFNVPQDQLTFGIPGR